MTSPILTYKPTGSGVHVDLDRLVASRMLVQANSGGGKSRAIRQLLEETHGRVMHLVIDPEGEFVTLRERFDYIIAAKTGGDAIASPKYAKRLCRTLVELNASAILDLYDLSLDERRWYVENFLTELMALPRDLWRPIIVVIDEMHVFAPEAGQARSAEAVTALATQGRKRGFCLVGATQRISKLHKDVAAELLNKMIGRTGLDIDVKRAGDELGMGKDDRNTLKTLSPGEFFVYGPAIANEVARVKTGDVVTSHPEAGRVGMMAPPPSAKVKAMLARLADLPKEAEEEARTIEDFKRQNADLRRKVTVLEKTGRVVEKPVTVVDQKAVERAVATAVNPLMELLVTVKRGITALVPPAQQLSDRLAALQAIDFDVKPDTNGNGNGSHQEVSTPSAVTQRRRELPGQPRGIWSAAAQPSVASGEAGRASRAVTGSEELAKGERVVLTAVAQYPDGIRRDELTVLTGYKRSTRDLYLQQLQRAGFVETRGGLIVRTDAGFAALGDDFEPLPTGKALRDYWLARLPEGERRVLSVLIEENGEPIHRDQLDERAGYKRSTRDLYLQQLARRRLVENIGGGQVRASATLFDEAGR